MNVKKSLILEEFYILSEKVIVTQEEGISRSCESLSLSLLPFNYSDDKMDLKVLIVAHDPIVHEMMFPVTIQSGSMMKTGLCGVSSPLIFKRIPAGKWSLTRYPQLSFTMSNKMAAQADDVHCSQEGVHWTTWDCDGYAIPCVLDVSNGDVIFKARPPEVPFDGAKLELALWDGETEQRINVDLVEDLFGAKSLELNLTDLYGKTNLSIAVIPRRFLPGDVE